MIGADLPLHRINIAVHLFFGVYYGPFCRLWVRIAFLRFAFFRTLLVRIVGRLYGVWYFPNI